MNLERLKLNMSLKILIFYICLGISALAQDCVPLTFSTLSSLVGHKVDYREWERQFNTNTNGAPSLNYSVECWNKYFPLHQLFCVYSDDIKIKFTDRIIQYNIPYLWIGYVPNQYKKNPQDRGSHAAIVIFREDRIDIIHTLSDDNGGDKSASIYYGGFHFVEKLTYKEFFPRTLVIYEIRESEFIKWKCLPDKIFK